MGALNGGRGLVSLHAAIFQDVRVAVEVRLGCASLSVAEVLDLKAGSIVPLDQKLADLVELRLNETLVARGEIVAVGDNFAVKITEIAEGQ